MAFPYLLCLFFFICTAAYSGQNNVRSSHIEIQETCKATRFPLSCQVSLIKSNLIPLDHPSPLEILQSSLSLSSKNLETTRFMVRAIVHYSSGNHNLTTSAQLCLDILVNSAYRLKTSENALPSGRIKDARAWTSAALSFQDDCFSGLTRVSRATDPQMVAKTLSFMNNTLITSTSNALSMMMSYQQYGNQTSLWGPPRTEREGFWESISSKSRSAHAPIIPQVLKPYVTVCKGRGHCTFESVQKAVNAAPNNLSGKTCFVIVIKQGVYEETVRIGLAKKNVMLIGDGIGKTVITGSLSVGKLGINTYNTATVGVVGDGFMARDLTIQNTAGAGAYQAVAFRSDSDLSVVENCEFIGNQDTLYVHSLRQLYKNCIIQGNVDFIFGNSASVFYKCKILIRPRQVDPMKGENSVISAHGRTDPAQATGFVFHECVINGTEEYMQLYGTNPKLHQTFLGRPWKEYSRCVFVRCKLEAIVSPLGWSPWDGDFALKTLYFGEFRNLGLGSNMSQRVVWSSRTPASHVDVYWMTNFIQGDEWKLT